MTVGGVAALFMATGSRAATTIPPPATVVVAPTASPQTTQAPPTTIMVREPGVAHVAPACPATTAYKDVQPGSAVFNAMVKAQSHLGSTLQQVQRYAATQTTFGDLRFGGLDNGFVVVSFVGDLQVHATALTSIVDVPDGVIVCPAVVTAASRAALANELVNRAGAAMIGGSLTPATGPPVVVLRADRRGIADELVAAYGSRVQVVLGNFVYPDPNVARLDTTLPQQPCGEFPRPGRASAALRWSVGKPLRVNTGGDITTNVSFRNTSLRSVPFDSGDPITGVVTRIGSKTIIARYNGAIGGVGFGGTLRPGDRSSLIGLVSTASCDATLGYALPPGRYTVRFLFRGYDTVAGGGTKIEQFVSTPIPLTITNDPPPPLPARAPLSPITIVPGSGGGGPGATLPAMLPAVTVAPVQQ